MPQNAFRRGFFDGWSSIRGRERPTIPAYSVEPGKDPYRAGVARGVQEACAKPPTGGIATADGWIDNALRRPRRPQST
jgi:hypothetical protein